MSYKKNNKPEGISLGQIRRGVLPKKYRHNKKIVEAFCLMHIMFDAIIIKHPRVVWVVPGPWLAKLESLFLTYNGIKLNVNGWYTPPPTNPALPDFLGLIEDFKKAQDGVAAKVPDGVNIRNAAWDKVFIAVKLIRNYVQVLANGQPEHAKEIAAEANMILVISQGREKQEFTAKSENETEVELSGVVRSQRQATDWEMTLDPSDPKGWYLVKIPPTLKAYTVVKGLKSGTYVYFRSRVILMEGPQEWSPVIKVMVK